MARWWCPQQEDGVAAGRVSVDAEHDQPPGWVRQRDRVGVAGSASGGGKAAQSLEGRAQQSRPRPAALQAQVEPSPAPNQAGSDVEEAVAEALRFPLGGLAVEAEALRPGDQVLGDEHQLQPDFVGGEVAEGQVAQPRRLAAADAVLDPGVATVTRLQGRQIGVRLVGDEHLKAKPS